MPFFSKGAGNQMSPVHGTTNKRSFADLYSDRS